MELVSLAAISCVGLCSQPKRALHLEVCDVSLDIPRVVAGFSEIMHGQFKRTSCIFPVRDILPESQGHYSERLYASRVEKRAGGEHNQSDRLRQLC